MNYFKFIIIHLIHIFNGFKKIESLFYSFLEKLDKICRNFKELDKNLRILLFCCHCKYSFPVIAKFCYIVIASQRRSNLLLIKLNFEIKFYSNWITSLTSVCRWQPLVMTALFNVIASGTKQSKHNKISYIWITSDINILVPLRDVERMTMILF